MEYSGKACLQEILRHYGLGSLTTEIVDASNGLQDWSGIIHAASSYGLRSHLQSLSLEELPTEKCPHLVRFSDGRFAILVLVHSELFFLLTPDDKQAQLVMDKEQFQSVWSGEVLVFSTRYNWQIFKRKYNLDWFFAVLKKYRQYLGEVLLAAFFLQLLGIVMPLMTQVIIDKVIGNHGVSTLTVLGCAMVVIFALQAILSGCKTYLLSHTANKVDALLGTRLFRHLLSLPLPYYENRRAGDILMRIETLGSIREFMTGVGMLSILDAWFALVFIAFMLYYSLPLTGIVLLVIPLYLLQNLWSVPIVRHKLDAVWQYSAQNQSFLVESINNISIIKAMDLSPQFMHKWEEMLAHYMRAAFEQAKFQVVITGFSGVIQSLSSIGVLWYGGHMVMAGEFTLGQLIAFQMLAGQAMEPLKKLLTIWPQVQQTGMALERMGDILATPREPVLEETVFNLPKLQGKIDIEHVYFRYRPDMPWVLSDISLHIAAGEKVAVIGPSGSGKSTLSKLLQGLYIPNQGEILLDDRINLQYPLSYLRRQIGAVIQESYLFNGSIRENIALAAPGTGMQKIIEAARLAGAHEFILELEDGYDTNVGEQGMALSGGQRQRIAIARMLLMDAGLLIFDEATSALDYASERSLMENLERIRQGRTMLVIAHRISMVACCDRVLVLDKGKIVDSGTPAELADRPGIYRDLCIQQKGME